MGVATGGGIIEVALGAGSIVGVGVAIEVAVGIGEAQAANAVSNDVTTGRVVTNTLRTLRTREWILDCSGTRSAGQRNPTLISPLG